MRAGTDDLTRTPEAKERARQAAHLGDAYERMAGRPVDARRLHQQALRLHAADEVARQGLARLDRAEQIDAHKELEVERLKELQVAVLRATRGT